MQTKWCPAPDCTCAVEFLGDENYDVLCNCKFSFCWNVCWFHSPNDLAFIFMGPSDQVCKAFQYSLPFAVHRGSSSTSELWDCIQVDIEEQRRIWTYELVCHKLNTVVLYAIFKFCFQFQCHHVLVQTGQDFHDCVLNNAIYYDSPPPPDYLFCNIPCFGSDWAQC